MVEPVRPQPAPQGLWSPFGIAWISILLSPLIGGILYALNERRFGLSIWRLTLYRNLLAGALFITISTLLKESPLPLLPLAANIFFGLYFYKSQDSLFAAHIDAGGGKAPFRAVLLLALAFTILQLLIFL
jgi:hypothetical protein